MAEFAESILPHTNGPCRNCPDRFYKDGHTCHETCENTRSSEKSGKKYGKKEPETSTKRILSTDSGQKG